jgi:TRIAD3 protein (E3 ubiquitin-protein ligase RNF216)
MKRIEEDLKRRTKLERSARPPRSSALAVDQVRKERAASAVECSCCFEQVPIDDMVACRDEGHLFCSTCLQTYVENQVFGNGNLGVSRETKKLELELKCFHGDDCASGFDEAFFEKALPSKVLGKLYAVQGQVNIEQAGLANVCKCPQCGFRAVLDTAQKVFPCPVDSCQFASCRYCGEASHSPLSCEQVKKQTEGRLTVEEAMSVAIIRKCPTCSQQFVKLGNGCNNVRYGCGTKVCYVCQKEILGYEHFDNGKCRLFTNIEKDDARARREAGLAAVQRCQVCAFVRLGRDCVLQLFNLLGLNRSKQDACTLQT